MGKQLVKWFGLGLLSGVLLAATMALQGCCTICQMTEAGADGLRKDIHYAAKSMAGQAEARKAEGKDSQ